MQQPDDSSIVPLSDAHDRPRPLTLKQERFVTYYLGEARGNGTEAARLAGYRDPQQAAYECKIHPGVRAAIDAFLAAESLSAAEVLHELSALASAPLEYFMQIQRESFENPQTHEVYPAIIKLDLSSKVRALETLARARGLLADKQQAEVSVKVVVGIDLDAL